MLQTMVYSLELELASRAGEEEEGGEEEMGQLTAHMSSLAAQSLTYCDSPSIIDGLELANWQALSAWVHQESHSTRAFTTRTAGSGVAATTTERDVYEEWLFTPVYRDKGLPLDKASLLPQLAACLSCHLPLVAADVRTVRPPLPYLPRSACCLVEVLNLDVTCPDLEMEGCGFNAAEVSQRLATEADNVISVLRQAGHGQAAYAALQRANAPLGSLLLGTPPELQTEVRGRCAATCQTLVGALLPRILAEGSRAVVDLGLGYLTSSGEDKRSTLTLLARLSNSLGLDYRRLGGLAMLGWRFCSLTGLHKQADQFSQLYVRAAWGRQTADMGICFKAAFSGGGKKEFLELVEKVVQHPQATVGLLVRFAEAFAIETDMAMTKLASWQLGRLEPHLKGEEKKEEMGEAVAGGGLRLGEVTEAASITALIEEALSMVKKDDTLYEYLLKGGNLFL